MRITLVGYMCSGKSTIGRKLSNTLHHNFIDLDEYIEEKFHISIWDFFKKYDQLAFRKIETETLQELVNEENFVLATGGGTACYYQNMDLINKYSFSFYLQLPYKELIHRIIESKKQRPILSSYSGPDLYEFIRKHVEERAFYYSQAQYSIDCKQKETDEIISEIMGFLSGGH